MGVKSFYKNMIIKDQEDKDQNSEKEMLKMSKYLKLDSH